MKDLASRETGKHRSSKTSLPRYVENALAASRKSLMCLLASGRVHDCNAPAFARVASPSRAYGHHCGSDLSVLLVYFDIAYHLEISKGQFQIRGSNDSYKLKSATAAKVRAASHSGTEVVRL